jgi:ferric-dicitrate binding protein FerR (iron transport regulator)
MNKLGQKYRDDTLSAEELQRLKAEVNALSDAEIGQQMYHAWMEEEPGAVSLDDERALRLKASIDAIAGRKRLRASLLRWGQVAAVALPVFILLALWLYRGNGQALQDETAVSTGRGDRADVCLPDGTQVALNANSTLTYTPRSFHKQERLVAFDGEGYFHICKAEGAPFRVNVKGMEVKALGTAFNLKARETDDTAELALEEGRVLITSVKSRQQVILQANRKALLDRRTGHIRVIAEKDIKAYSAWRRGDMVFRNVALSLVLKRIEENYGVAVTIGCREYLDDLFTGTLPAGNLNEALEALEKSFHLHATTIDNRVRLLCY